MRKFLIILVAALTLSTGSVFAQSSGQWAGLSTGYPFGVILHYGIDNLISDALSLDASIDLRANLSAVTFFGSSGFSVTGGADALYNLELETVNDLPLAVYAGGGIGIGISIGDETGFSGSLRGLVGAEYMFNEQFGAFGELRVGLGLAPLFQPNLAVGVNYHF